MGVLALTPSRLQTSFLRGFLFLFRFFFRFFFPFFVHKRPAGWADGEGRRRAIVRRQRWNSNDDNKKEPTMKVESKNKENVGTEFLPSLSFCHRSVLMKLRKCNQKIFQKKKKKNLPWPS